MELALPAPEGLSSPSGVNGRKTRKQQPLDTRESEFLYKPGTNTKNLRANLGIVEECCLC